MSEAPSWPAGPARGRGTARRGGFGGRSGRRPHRTKSVADGADQPQADGVPQEDEGDVGELRRQYGGKIGVVCEVFPDWSDIDALFALQSADGDEVRAIELIASGAVAKFGEVKKTPRSRTKDSTVVAAQDPPLSSGRPRSGHAASEVGRGRAKNFDRGQRGRSKPAVNGSRVKDSPRLAAPADSADSWNGEQAKPEASWASTWDSSWEAENPRTETNEPVNDDHGEVRHDPAQKPSSVPAQNYGTGPAQPHRKLSTKLENIPGAPQKTWASMLRQSTAPKVAPKPKETAPMPIHPVVELPTPAELNAAHTEEAATTESTDEEPSALPERDGLMHVVEPDVALPPSKDQLTESNLELVLDASHPPTTATAASTAADSWDPRAIPPSASGTPLPPSQQQHQPPRSVASGFAASALKATAERPVRTPSFQRRLLDQQEAVRMPSNREVDRAAVQFGAFSLNGAEEDIDGDREEPETRTQPPADSPVAHPRTSLPPASITPVPDSFSAQRPPSAIPAVGLPPLTASPSGAPPSLANASSLSTASSIVTPNMPTPASTSVSEPNQSSHQTVHQYGRFAASDTTAPHDASSTQKSYETYQTQSMASSGPQHDHYATQPTQPVHQQQHHHQNQQNQHHQHLQQLQQLQHHQHHQHHQHQQQQQQQLQLQQQQQQQPSSATAVSSAPSEYPSYYASDHQSRQAYNNFYGHYAQQQQGHHQAAHLQHDAAGNQGRAYGGYNATNSEIVNYPQIAVSHNQARFNAAQTESQNSGHSTPNPQGQTQHQAAVGFQPQSHGQQTYHPYMGNPYYHQFFYGAAPYPKNNMYNQPYGASPQAHYDHASAGFGQSAVHRADGTANSGQGEYGRVAAGQTGGISYTNAQDAFQRGTFQSQAGQSYNAPQAAATGAAGTTDDLKPFNDSSKGSNNAGPSPAMVGARPISVTNPAPATAQAGLPLQPAATAAHMGSYNGYPAQLQAIHAATNAYGVAAASQHSGSQPTGAPYGAYGASAYYTSGGQQRGGWGSNYH